MLTRAFSDILAFFFSYNHFSRHTNISFIYTHHLHVFIALSLVFLCVSSCFGWFGGFFFSRHAPPVVENAQSVFLFPSGFVVQDANRPAGCAFTVARSRVMMLVPVCSAQFLSLFFFFFLLSLYLFWMSISMSVGDYPYKPPHSNWANISETGPQSVSTTGGLRGLLCVTWKWFKEGVSLLWWTILSASYVTECKSSHHSLVTTLCMHRHSTSNVWRYWNVVALNRWGSRVNRRCSRRAASPFE